MTIHDSSKFDQLFLHVKPTQSTAPATPDPRRPYKLRDQVPPSSSFYQFRERLKQAIRDHDAEFIAGD